MGCLNTKLTTRIVSSYPSGSAAGQLGDRAEHVQLLLGHRSSLSNLVEVLELLADGQAQRLADLFQPCPAAPIPKGIEKVIFWTCQDRFVDC